LAKEEASCKTKYTDKNKKKFTNLVQFLQLAPPRLESSIELRSGIGPAPSAWIYSEIVLNFASRAGAGVDKIDSRTLFVVCFGFCDYFIFATRSFRVGFPSMVVVVLGSSNAGHHVN
jgi:hypothetical protein